MPRKAKKNVEQVYNIRRAVNFTKTAISHNEKRLTYPELFSQTSQEPSSPLHLSSQYTRTDLIELTSAIECLGVFVYADSRQASLKNITLQFEQMLNVKFNDCYEMRRRIAMRKVHKTPFIDKLKNAQLKKIDL